MTELQQKCLALLKQNPNRVNAAKALGVSAGFVSHVARAHKIPKENKMRIPLEDADLIEALFQHGLTRQEIAEKYECHVHNVKNYCNKLGIEMTDERKRKSKKKSARMAKANQMMRLAVSGKHVTARVHRMLELGVLGRAETSIAAELGVSVRYVRKVLAAHGIRPNSELDEIKQQIARAEQVKQYYNGSVASALVGEFGMGKSKAYYWVAKLAA